MAWSGDDISYMQLCLDLARKAEGHTSPNPMVGAVLVSNATIIGQGYHHVAGGAHAEIEAIRSASGNVEGATMYVSLEPCCSHGKTPPCTATLIEQKLAKVFVATLDANPLVAGKGVEQLRAAGIEVKVGLLEQKAIEINEIFFKYITTGFPFCVLKTALSLDGKIATAHGKSKWISSIESRTDAHLLRRNLDAILVGVETVLADDPDLTVRHVASARKQPAAIILDPFLRCPLGSRLFRQARQENHGQARTIWVVTSSHAPAYKLRILRQNSIECLVLQSDKRGFISIQTLFRELGKKGITSILIEGGPTVAARALREKMVDKIIYYIAPKIIGDHGAPGPVSTLDVVEPDQALSVTITSVSRLGNDLKLVAYIREGASLCSRE